MEIYRTFLDEQAKRRFLEIQGTDREDADRPERWKNIEVLYTQKKYLLDGRMNKIEKQELRLSGEVLRCELFEKIIIEPPEKAVFFLVSVNNKRQSTLELSEKVRGLATKTSYLDAARWWLEDKVRFENPGKRVSQSFGPGYMKIATDALPTFYRLADGRQAGSFVNSYGFLEPETSCAFFHFVGGRVMKENGCLYCNANKSGCRWCINGGKKGY